MSRDEMLEPKRVKSVFRERVEKHKEEIAELEEREKLSEKEKPVSKDYFGIMYSIETKNNISRLSQAHVTKFRELHLNKIFLMTIITQLIFTIVDS